MSAAWTDRVLHRPDLAAMLVADPAVDLEDCRLVSVTLDGARFDPLVPDLLPLWRADTVTVEVATPAGELGAHARLLRLVGYAVSAYRMVGVIDGRSGTLRLQAPRPRVTHLAPGEPEPVWLSFSAEQTRLRARVEVVELDSARCDLAGAVQLPRCASRVTAPAASRLWVSSCAVGDVGGLLELAISRRPSWTCATASTLVEGLCRALGLEHVVPDGDEEWVVLLAGGARGPAGIVHLFTPLVVFCEETIEREAHDRGLIPEQVATVRVPSYRTPCLRAASPLLDRLTRGQLREKIDFDDELFSAEDLWFEGT